MNNLRKTLILLISFLISFFPDTVFSQSNEGGRISGKVNDAETGSPVDFASVALVNKADGKTIRGTKTDLEGNFSIENIPNGSYEVRISFIGYKPFSRGPVQISASRKSVSLGTIKLASTEAKVLQEVVVQGQRNTIQLGIDRKVFNVEQSLVSEGGSATDLLANIPSLSVDIDGNVSLRGTSSVRILIDGKPSAVGDITQFLQSMPASSIQNIELITNPSSKYDAEGQSGIINIVLKKDKRSGINGSVALTGGTQDNYNANTSLNVRTTKWNLFGNYSFRQGNYLGSGFNNTQYLDYDGRINNLSESQRKHLNNSVRAGVDFSPNEKTTIGVSGNLSFRDNKRNEDLVYRYFNIPQQDNENSSRITRQNENDKGYDFSFDFNRQLKRKGEVLTANFSYGKDTEDGIERFNQEFYSGTTTAEEIDRRINDTYEDGRNTNIQIDYTLPFSEGMKFEAGYRTSIRKNDESQLSDIYDPQTGSFVRDYTLTNDFDLEDIVHAGYFNYQNQLTKNFGFQVGLRAEQAYLNTNLRARNDADSPVYNTEGKLDYFRVYPSVFLTQKLKGENQLQLSYTRRVNRPRGWQINPFMDVSDPNSIRMGNPNLKPEDIHAFEFSYMKYWKAVTLTSSVYFRQVNDVVEMYTSPMPGNPAATLSQFFNFSKNQATGIEFITRADVAKGITLTGNLNLFYNKYSGFEHEGYKLDPSDSYNWNTNLTADLRFLKVFTAQLRGDYRAPSNSPQGRRREMYGLDGAVRMDVLDKKGSIALNVRNILDSRKWSGLTETNLFVRDFERRWAARMASITFSYRFGKQDLNLRNRRNNNNPDQQQQSGPPEEGMF